jgi:CDP-diacylglycerol pyrophosphatase
MASSNFDELTKTLATSTSRRQTIKVLFASALGGALGLGGMGVPQAEGWSGVGTPGDNCDTGGLCGLDTDDVAIWKSIQDCVKNNKCSPLVVDHTSQWVLYEELKTNYTLFAGQRIKGIECSKIWEHTDPNYWDFAWNAALKYLARTDRIGLAINSKYARTRCQLHIHVSCIRRDVRATLEKNDGSVAKEPSTWKSHTLSLGGYAYRVLWLNLDHTFLYYGQNLFQLLWNYIVHPNGEDMANQTLVATVRPGGGFYILNSMPGLSGGGTGFGEGLLDEACS